MQCGQPEAVNGGRPLTYNKAETVYQANLTAARDRCAELSDRNLSATTAALLRERGEFDPQNLGHQVVAASQPLSAAERLEHMAIGEVLARYYRHPSMLDQAVKAGASWDQVGAARGTSADQARQDYREWADGQHNLLTWTEGRFGMSDAEYAQAMGRIGAAGPALNGGKSSDFASDITRRAQWARDHNDGKPEPAWSTGERLAVALVLGDQATLDAEDYTRKEAEQRLAGDLAFYGYTADAGTWLAEIRAEVGLPRITEG
jgi:hypothetical protein